MCAKEHTLTHETNLFGTESDTCKTLIRDFISGQKPEMQVFDYFFLSLVFVQTDRHTHKLLTSKTDTHNNFFLSVANAGYF